MRGKTIRIWKDNKVLQVVNVSDESTATIGGIGGAANSINVDIEIDPWKGLIVDHTTTNPPMDFHRPEEFHPQEE